jgi:hypothetical protein
VNPIELSAIAATGHDPPAGAHMILIGVILVGVVVAVVAARRRRPDADESPDRPPVDDPEQEPGER